MGSRYIGDGRIMHAPRTLDRVYIDGSEKVYLVTWIDDERRLVDLIPITGNGPTEESAPWERLYALDAHLDHPGAAPDRSLLFK